MKIDNVKFDSVTISSCPHGEVLFDTPGTFSWVAPAGVTSVSVVAVSGGGGGAGGTDTTYGGGGGGGGALAFVNSVAVTPGETLTVVVGASGNGGAGLNVGTSGGLSSIARAATILLQVNGGTRGNCFAIDGNSNGGTGGTVVTGSGGAGGVGGVGNASGGAGGGGAGGYSGTGGAGTNGDTNGSPTGGSGSGGAGAGGAGSNSRGGGGGGVGLNGIGADGVGGIINISGGGQGGGGGSNGSPGALGDVAGTGIGGLYGGGGGGATDSATATGAAGAQGAVRIIWGIGRLFPSTNVVQVTDYGFDIVRPVEFYVDATNPASYLSGGSLIDISGQSLANGTTATVTSLVGAGISFPGTGVGFNHGNILGTIANSSWSFGYWVKFNNVTTAQTVMEKTSSNSTGWSVGIRTTGNLRMNIGSQLYNVSVAAELFTVGTWTHVVVTISSGGLVTNYINGANSNSVAFTAPVTSDSGSFYVGSNASSGYLNGSVGEAFFYRKELTAAEALQNYTNTKWKYGL